MTFLTPLLNNLERNDTKYIGGMLESDSQLATAVVFFTSGTLPFHPS